MEGRRHGFGIEVLAGVLLGLLAEMGFDKPFFNLVRHPNLWPAARSYLASHLFYALLLGAAISTLLIVLGRVKAWAQAAPLKVKDAVGRKQLLAGALAGGGGMALGIAWTFLGLIDNPRTPLTCAALIVGSILTGVVGAALLTTIAYTAAGSKKRPGAGWAAVGGLLGGFIGFMLLISLAYSF